MLCSALQCITVLHAQVDLLSQFQDAMLLSANKRAHHYTFVNQLKCLDSIVYLQVKMQWHARQLLESVLRIIINVNNQQQTDEAACGGLLLISPDLRSNYKQP